MKTILILITLSFIGLKSIHTRSIISDYNVPYHTGFNHERDYDSSSESDELSSAPVEKRAFEGLGKKRNMNLPYNYALVEKRAFEGLGKRAFEGLGKRAFEGLGKRFVNFNRLRLKKSFEDLGFHPNAY